MDKPDRLKRAKDNLVGIDSAPMIRKALAELREEYAIGRRMAEVDGPETDVDLDVPVMLIEDAADRWTCVTTKDDMWHSQKENFAVIERTEKLAVAEMRWKLVERLVSTGFCRPEAAKKNALKARIWVAGRVPFLRIVSR